MLGIEGKEPPKAAAKRSILYQLQIRALEARARQHTVDIYEVRI
jgi:hypothetical protein